MPITKREAEECDAEAEVIKFRLGQRYSRKPDKRKEAYLEMDYRDRLESKRDALVFLEFAPTWVGRTGELP